MTQKEEFNKAIEILDQIEENINISEQNPGKLGETIPELLPKAEFKKIEKMAFSLAKIQDFLKEDSLVMNPYLLKILKPKVISI